MSINNKGDGARAAGAAIESFSNQRSALTAERDETSAALGRVRAELRATTEEVVSALLPHAQAAHLANLDGCLPGLGLASERTRREGKQGELGRRLGEIEADSDFVAREALLSDYNGELGHELYRLKGSCTEAQERRDGMEACPTFVFALNARTRQAEGTSAFATFWRAVTFAATREKSARKASCQKFGYADWDSLIAEYEGFYSQLAVDLPRLAELQDRRQRLENLVQEHEDARGWCYHFEERLATHLRDCLAERLGTMRLDALCARVRGKAVALIARFDALRAKVNYLESLETYLESEILDRQKRISKLTYVRNRWAAKPYASLRSDKTKWLVTVPAIKAESCDKCCRWSRRLRQNLEDYRDIEGYAAYLAGIPAMLAYDAFAYGSSEAMPYEGFTRQVIPALDRYRASKGQARADYAPFKAIDKASGKKTRDPGEESGVYDNPEGDMEISSESESEDIDYDPFEERVAISSVAYYETSSSMDYGDYS